MKPVKGAGAGLLGIVLAALAMESGRPKRERHPRGTVARDSLAWVFTSRSRHMPHQGHQEAERRLRQGRRSDFAAWTPHPSKR